MNIYLLSADTSGALFMLFYTLFYFMFSILIWYIFYRIPDKSGMISKHISNPITMPASKRCKSSILRDHEVSELLMHTEEPILFSSPNMMRSITVANENGFSEASSQQFGGAKI